MSLCIKQAVLTASRIDIKPPLLHNEKERLKNFQASSTQSLEIRDRVLFLGHNKPDFKMVNHLINQSEFGKKLQSYHCKNIYKPLQLETIWMELPYAMRKMLNTFLKGKNPEISLEKAIKSGKIGILEESADLWYETLLLGAIREGVFNESMVEKSLRFIKFDPNGKHLSQAVKEVKKWISDEDVIKFALMSDIKQADAKEFIAINYLKFAALRLEKRCEKIHPTVVKQTEDEYMELVACFPPLQSMAKKDNRRKQIGKLKQLVATLQHQRFLQKEHHFVVKKIRDELVQLLQDTLGQQKFSEKILFDFIQFKHALRQSIRLENLHKPEMNYDRRKSIVKPFELLIETILLDLTK